MRRGVAAHTHENYAHARTRAHKNARFSSKTWNFIKNLTQLKFANKISPTPKFQKWWVYTHHFQGTWRRCFVHFLKPHDLIFMRRPATRACITYNNAYDALLNHATRDLIHIKFDTKINLTKIIKIKLKSHILLNILLNNIHLENKINTIFDKNQFQQAHPKIFQHTNLHSWPCYAWPNHMLSCYAWYITHVMRYNSWESWIITRYFDEKHYFPQISYKYT